MSVLGSATAGNGCTKVPHTNRLPLAPCDAATSAVAPGPLHAAGRSILAQDVITNASELTVLADRGEADAVGDESRITDHGPRME